MTPIRLQTQGPSECFPTSVCMALGVDWIYVRPVIEAALGKKWGETGSDIDRKAAIELLLDYLGAPEYFIEAGWTFGSGAYRRGPIPKFSRVMPPESMNGTWLLAVANRKWNRGHVVVLSDGLVYDPNWTLPRDFPLTFEAWANRYWMSGWRPSHLLTVPEE